MPKSDPPRDTIRRWHAALAYAITGAVPAGLREPGGVDIAVLAADLDRLVPGGLVELRGDVQRRRDAGWWPYRVPAELMEGLRYAQFRAALDAVSRALGIPLSAEVQVTADRPLTAEERRLRQEVPPHHGNSQAG